MRMMLKSVVVSLALAGAPLGAITAANAAVGVTFDIGNVAIGYSDGYYDNNHNWHPWAHPADARRFRAAHKGMYHAWRHDDPKHQEH